MSEQIPVGQPALRGRTLALIVGGGVVAGTLVVLGAILPAEFNRDPLGIGKLTGIARLWAPEEKAFSGGAGASPAYSSGAPIQRTVYEIPLGAEGWDEAALEIKVGMTAGQTMIYRWEVLPQGDGQTAPLEFDFHGHTLEDGEAMTVAEFRKDRALSDTGGLSAPFDGIHGWYFKNHSPDPVTVRLVVEGFYTVIPAGAAGNEFGLRPVENAPAP
jgi:hypothetical protein